MKESLERFKSVINKIMFLEDVDYLLVELNQESTKLVTSNGRWIELNRFEEVEIIRIFTAIRPSNVFVDSGYNTQKVYEYCKAYGFTPIKFHQCGVTFINNYSDVSKTH